MASTVTRWLPPALLLAVLAMTTTAQITDEVHYTMPRLYHLDEYGACVAARGLYCLGSFRLRPHNDSAMQLFHFMQQYSRSAFHFNRTLLHRGYCVTSRCAHARAASPAKRFTRCVAERTRRSHGLDASLLRLEYCESPQSRMRADSTDAVDLLVAAVAAAIVLLNVVGTAYDYLRSRDTKSNKYLLVWSVRESWRRLTASYDDGDPRLTALKSVQGIRTICIAIVMLAHSLIALHMGYIYNPQYIERGNYHFLSIIFHNGSVLVQTFFLLSSFLLAYNLLLYAEKQKIQLSISMLPKCILHRVIRILPLHVFVVAVSATWWTRVGSGPQWWLVRQQAAACRRKWWAHALFINNLVDTDNTCLIQSWFLAADMQLYVVCAAVTLAVAGRGLRSAARLLAGLVLVAALAVALLAYCLQLQPIMLIMNPEVVRSQYAGVSSFKWLYAAPWGSLPTALLGVLLAFLHRDLQRRHVRPERSTIFRLAYPMFVPALVVWIACGHALRGAPPAAVALYAALDRLGYALIFSLGLIGIFNNVDSIWKRLAEWSGWMPLGRMSLAVLLVHWNYNLVHVALHTQPSRIAIYELGEHWRSVEFMTYITALPLHLCLEIPAQRFLQTYFFGT